MGKYTRRVYTLCVVYIDDYDGTDALLSLLSVLMAAFSVCWHSELSWPDLRMADGDRWAWASLMYRPVHHVVCLHDGSVHDIDFSTGSSFPLSELAADSNSTGVSTSSKQPTDSTVSVSRWRRWLSICVLLFTTLDITSGMILIESLWHK